MPTSVASGMTRWPKPSMASGKEMKEPSRPSFMTILGPAHTRSSSEGASRVTLRKARCCTVHDVKLCHMLELSKTGAATEARPSAMAEGDDEGDGAQRRSGAAWETRAMRRRWRGVREKGGAVEV